MCTNNPLLRFPNFILSHLHDFVFPTQIPHSDGLQIQSFLSWLVVMLLEFSFLMGKSRNNVFNQEQKRGLILFCYSFILSVHFVWMGKLESIYSSREGNKMREEKREDEKKIAIGDTPIRFQLPHKLVQIMEHVFLLLGKHSMPH
jgi:hypothetical protein